MAAGLAGQGAPLFTANMINRLKPEELMQLRAYSAARYQRLDPEQRCRLAAKSLSADRHGSRRRLHGGDEHAPLGELEKSTEQQALSRYDTGRSKGLPTVYRSSLVFTVGLQDQQPGYNNLPFAGSRYIIGLRRFP